MCTHNFVSLLFFGFPLWASAYRRSSWTIDAAGSRLSRAPGQVKILRSMDYRLDDWPIAEMLASALLATEILRHSALTVSRAGVLRLAIDFLYGSCMRLACV